MPRKPGNMWRFPIRQLHVKQVALVSVETLSRGPWLTTGGCLDGEFIQTRELQMAGPTAIQEKVQACNGISHLPFVPGTSCFSSKSIIETSFMVFVVAKSLPCSSCSPFCIQPFGSFSLAPCLRSRRRRRTPSIFLPKLSFIFPNTDSLTLRLECRT